jgi:hypothetical protein
MEVSAAERASSRVGILEVALHDDVSAHDDLTDCLAVTWDIYELFAGRFCGANDTEWKRGRKGMTLPSRKFGPLGGGQCGPRRLRIITGEGPIRLAAVFWVHSEMVRTRENWRQAPTYVRP